MPPDPNLIPTAAAAAPPKKLAKLSYPDFREWLAEYFKSCKNVGDVNVPYVLNTLDQLIDPPAAPAKVA